MILFIELQEFLSESDVPPINGLDAAARIHDFAYGKAGEDKKAINDADRELIRRVKGLPKNPRKWNWYEPGHPTEEDIKEAELARRAVLVFFIVKQKVYKVTH